MAGNVFTADEARQAQIEVIEDGRGTQAVHDVVTAMRANRRSGTAHTKTRGEVKASNKKPWRQKGTGRARAGRVSSPIWRGGGIVFGPRNRSYAKDVNKRTRRLAFRKALSARIIADEVLLVPEFEIADGKTKSFVSHVTDLISGLNVLVIADKFSDQTYLAGRNVSTAQLITAAEASVEQLLRYDKIIITQESLQTLSERSAR